MTLSVKLATSVSKLSVAVPTLAAVMFRLWAVMSTPVSPSNTAPEAVKPTARPVALTLPTVKLPAVTFTVTLPLAFTWVKDVAPTAFKLNRPVVLLATVKALASFR